jgi:cAMP-dependent protein kinase regulator
MSQEIMSQRQLFTPLVLSIGIGLGSSGGDAAPVKVAERGAGTSFGELALLYNSPRAATITALADAVVWAIHRVPFRRTLKRVNVKKIDEYSKFLEKVPDMGALTSHERTKIAEALDAVAFAAGAVICRQGEPGDMFYIIKSGACRVEKRGADGVTIEAEMVLKAGDYFGEVRTRVVSLNLCPSTIHIGG